MRDVTAEHEIAQMKNEFVSTVSHELRTPLTSIKGYVDLILDGDAGEINEIQHEFLGIVTHPRIFRTPTPIEAALDQATAWLESPSLVVIAETYGYFTPLSELVASAKITGPRIHDARIAALCLHHAVRELWSADRNFSMFPGLRVHNPLLS